MKRLEFTHTFLLLCTLFCRISAAWALPPLVGSAIRNLPFPQQAEQPFEEVQSQPQPQKQPQRPIMEQYPPNTVLPTSTPPTEDVDPKSGHKTGPIVADVLPKIKGINIFASLTRDFESIATRLNDSSQNVTVLAPRNSAIQGLPRKPWENPEDYEKFGEVQAYQGSGGEDRAKRNLRRFVEAHLIPTSPWRKDEEVETLGGGKLKWSKDGEKIYVCAVCADRICLWLGGWLICSRFNRGISRLIISRHRCRMGRSGFLMGWLITSRSIWMRHDLYTLDLGAGVRYWLSWAYITDGLFCYIHSNAVDDLTVSI